MASLQNSRPTLDKHSVTDKSFTFMQNGR